MTLKSHFKFSNQQRNGIFLLLIIIITLQCVYGFVNFSSEETPINKEALNVYIAEVDSLKVEEIENRKPKIFPFNPNFISDYKGYTLGLSNKEINRLLKFRAQNKWINSTKQFQEVTKVSDSVLKIISPYFKFPKWVTQKTNKQNYLTFSNKKEKPITEKIDLNKATIAQLKKVYGIGETFANRIIKYKNKHQGFASIIELNEVYGLKPETIENIKKSFYIKTPRVLNRISLNKATRDQLVTIKYIDYEIAHHIIEQRTLRDGFKSFEELAKVKDFPIKKIEIIKLYLTLN